MTQNFNASILASEKIINWNNLQEPVKTRFLETKVQRRCFAAVASIFATLAGAGACAIGAGVAFTATPLAVIGVTAGLGFIALASATTAIVLLCLKTSTNDPAYLIQQKQEAGELIKNNPKTGFEEITRKYNSKIITNSELNILLAKDLQELSYVEFRQKNGNRVDGFLNSKNHNMLREKCLSYCQSEATFKEIQSDRGIQLLKLKKEDWAEKVALREVNFLRTSGQDYKTFIYRNEEAAIGFIRDPNALDYLASTFEKDILSNYTGINSFNAKIKIANAFGAKFTKALMEKIEKQEIQNLLNGTLDYESFRSRNGVEVIRDIITSFNGCKELFRKKFLELPLRLQEKFQQDQNLLGISSQVKKNNLLAKWKNLPFKEIVKDPEFTASLKDVFFPHEWKSKALEATKDLSVIEIAKQMPIIFSGGILVASDLLNPEMNIGAKLQEELKSYQTIQEICNLPSVLFETKLINQGDLTVRRAVKEFMKENFKSYLGNNWIGNPIKIKELISRYDLMPQDLSQELQLKRKEYADHQAAFQKVAAQINTEFEQVQQVFQNRNDLLKKGAESYTLESKRKVEELKVSLNAIDHAIQSLSQQQTRQQISFQIISVKHSKKIPFYERKLTELNYRQIALSIKTFVGEIRSKENLLARKNQELAQLKASILQNPALVQMNNRLSLLKQQEIQLKTKIGSLQQNNAEYHRLVGELVEPQFSQKRASMEKKIQELESAPKVVAGLGNAFKKLSEQSEIKTLKKTLAEMDLKKQKFAALQSEISSLTNRSPNGLSMEIQRLQNSLNAALSEKNDLIKSLPALKQQIENNCGLSRLENEIISVSAQVQSHRAEVEELNKNQKRVDLLNAKILKLNNEFEKSSGELRETSNQLSKQLSEKTGIIPVLEFANNDYQSQLNRLNTKNAGFDAEFNREKAIAEQSRNKKLTQAQDQLNGNLTSIESNFLNALQK